MLLSFVYDVQAQKSNGKTSDLDFIINEVETNYAGFIDKTDTPAKKAAYDKLKTSLYNKVKKGKATDLNAVGEYIAWFEDIHLRSGLVEHQKYRKKKNVSYAGEYNPQPMATKVDDNTFLIRFPSCGGDPSIEWSNNAIAQYFSSGSENLILDIRGNGGGDDMMYAPYLDLLYDTSGETEGVEIRNTPAHLKYLEGRVGMEGMEWLKEVIDNMKVSKADFVTLVGNHTIEMDSVCRLPKKAALIIDGYVASSGEQLTLELRICSKRTTIYGKDNTLGCLDYSNIRRVDLPLAGISTWIPMTRFMRLPDESVDAEGIAPDVRITLPQPAKLTDNVDEWVLWVAKNMNQ